MKNKQRNFSPNKNIIINTRNEISKSPLKYRKRRKSSIPLQITEFIKKNGFHQINCEAFNKDSYKGDYSGKKVNIKNIINTSIPEVSENSSNNRENKNKKTKKKQAKKENKNEKENHNYYIDLVQNIYEKEPHLGKENLIKSEKKKDNDNNMKLNEVKQNFKKITKRRNSELTKFYLKYNFNKEPITQNIKSSTLINKKKSCEIMKLAHKKNSEEKEKNKSNRKNKEKHKIKEKHDNKEIKDNNKHTKNGDNTPKKNSGSIIIKKKVREKDTLENEKKTENDNNINENKSPKKINKLKKFFCCLINNGESSIDND